MKNINKKVATIAQDIYLGDINEIKKLSLLDQVGEILTYRIIARLIDETTEEKRDVFIEKINANKDDPNKILLFIDHFVDNADKIIDEEIDKYKKDLKKVVKTKSGK